MTVESFNEEKILSLEDLLERLHRHIDNLHGDVDKTFSEVIRRKEEKRGFLKKLCSQSIETWVWWILFEAGRAQRFIDIFRVAGCSRWKLNEVLQKLLRAGLVRMVDNRYQAIIPPWLVQFLN